MSVYSGKCDLADYIAGMGGWFDKEGNPVKFGDKGVSCYYSDEWLDFLVFKRKTGGVLYQHKNVKVTSYNKDDIKNYCKEFDYKEVRTKVEDKRSKSGYREDISYTYIYYGKEYTEKELNKKGGIYITVEIHFNTLLELLPYYPYLVSMASSSDGKATVYISQNSFVEDEFDSLIKHGIVSNMRNFYHEKLAKHYQEVVLNYYNPRGHEITEEVEFDEDGIGYTSKIVNRKFDLNWDIDWLIEKNGHSSHWASPELIEGNKIKMHEEDLKHYIGNKARVKYVEYFPIKERLV